LEYGLDEREVDFFIAEILDISLSDVQIQRISKKLVLNKDEQKKLDFYVKMRLNGHPLQYIVNKAYFMECVFYVDENVLIPRSDTEILVENALKLLKNNTNPKVLDLCCGSGCIGISMLYEMPSLSVVMADISKKAIKISKKNIIQNLGSNKNINVILHDILKNDNIFSEFDMICSNPPYLSENDMKNLDKDVKKEPILALNGGFDGLDFYRLISEKYYKSLKINGYLVFEVGINQSEEVVKILKKNNYKDIKIIKDYNKIDRVVIGKK